ncbi:cyclase family protein [Mangrovivirga sp. M17]|uniref:Cyclase family protein n=1 Tax=Mangrovivirga halotolerans TaxID=2993936 RepID=A0ABT3RMQ8_9BACT|nr:cyclase family protein [Mangrovivirga halotolerans]MCX2743099.1 cyclase family protein [Mangrovivirga halotolerans]
MKTLIIFTLIGLLFSCKESASDNTTTSVDQESDNLSSQIINSKIVDLTYDYSEETIFWVTAKEFELEEVAYGETDNGFFYSANNFCMAEHGGTHIDAPIHFAKGKQSVDEIPLKQIIGTGIKIDVSKNASKNTDYLVTINDLKQWEQQTGRIPDNSIILLYTGHSSNYPDKEKYLGTSARGTEAIKDLHFPGLSPEAAEWLTKERKVKAVGIDTPSIDYGQSSDFKSHVILLTENIPAFENVANMNQLPDTGFTIIALPIKIKGGSGGPLRIIAIL